jgi:hypothetical protein
MAEAAAEAEAVGVETQIKELERSSLMKALPFASSWSRSR